MLSRHRQETPLKALEAGAWEHSCLPDASIARCAMERRPSSLLQTLHLPKEPGLAQRG